MTGITFDELYDFIEHNHEIEFTYLKEEYTIEPAGNADTVIFESGSKAQSLKLKRRKETGTYQQTDAADCRQNRPEP